MRKLTTEEFITKAKEVHGDKYDYSKVIYIRKRDKVAIICPIHGEFNQLAGNHLRGQGCPKCGKEYCKNKFKNNYTHFIQESTKRFGKKFDFPNIKTEYENSHSKITIKCKKCGNIFIKRAGDHLTSKKGGCKNCKKQPKQKRHPNKYTPKLTKEIAKERIDKLLNGNFEYNIDEYVNTSKPFNIKCLKCGNVFKRHLNALTYNNTCPYCNGKPRNRKYNTQEFIKVASQRHNNKYDYSETIYESSDKKVIIICNEIDAFGEKHGKFYVTPHAHIGKMKSGCPKCSGKYKKTTEDFIKESNLVHDNFYDYSKTEYINAKTKTNIICPIHGEFQQTPNNHLNGDGCPVCKQSKYERKIRKFLKENNINFISQYKPVWLGKMSLDFFLPQYNVAIEVQGIQHYKPIKYWGDKETFQKVLDRDNLKRKLCEENNIKLLYYTELNVNEADNTIKNTNKLLEILI